MKTEWLIICDLDEFFYGYPDILYKTIDLFSNYNVIYSNWLMFGSDNHIKHPDNIIKSIIYIENQIIIHILNIFLNLVK
jgi:hypothetical protein